MQTHAAELSVGSLTYHVMPAASAVNHSNKLSADGSLIANPMVGVGLLTEQGLYFERYTAFLGENSIGAPIAGFMYSEGLSIRNLQLGYAYGFYMQCHECFIQRYIKPMRLIQVENTDLVPILGLVVNYKFGKLRLNNLVSPILLNTTFSVAF